MARRRRPLPYGPQFGVDADGKPVIRPNPNDPIARARGVRPMGSPEILRRQRVLKAKGYQLVVDGRWGPLSQRFWKHYLSTRRAAVKPKVPVTPQMPAGLAARDVIEQRGSDAAAVRARAQEFARVAKENAQVRVKAAKLAAQGSLMAQLGVGVAGLHKPAPAHLPRNVAGKLTKAVEPKVGPGEAFARTVDPRRAMAAHEKQRLLDTNQAQARKAWSKPTEKWTTHDVWLLAANQATRRLDLQNPQHVRRVQHWLTSKGHKVPLTGSYDEATRDAFLAVAADEQHRAQVKTATDFVDKTFGAGIFQPGQAGLPVYGGAFPKPGDLVKLLTNGSFSSHLLFTQLWQRTLAPDSRYLLWAEGKLASIEHDLFGPFLGPEWLRGQEALVERGARIGIAAASLGSEPRNDTRNDTFLPNVAALAGSRTAAEYQRKLKAIAADDERRYKASQIIKALNEPGFWSKALDSLSYPADKSFEYLQTATVLMNDALKGAGTGGRTGADPGKAHERALAYQKFLKENHPWQYLGITLLVDPLNFTPGFGAFRAGGRASTEALAAAGLALTRKGTVVGAENLYRLDSIAYKGVGGALRAPDHVLTQMGLEWRATKDALDVNEAALGKVWRTGARLKRLKDETHQVALTKARVALRRGFRKPASEPLSLADRDLYTNVDWYTFDGEFGAGLEDSARTSLHYLQKHNPVLLDALVRDRISFAGVDSREMESLTAGMLVGRLGAEAQHTSIEMVAREARTESFNRLAAQYETLPDDELLQVAAHVGVDLHVDISTAEGRTALIRRMAAAKSQEDYDHVLGEAAFYAAGGADPAISSRVDHLASRALDRLITILHADVQEYLEEQASARVAGAIEKGMDPKQAQKRFGLFDNGGYHKTRAATEEDIDPHGAGVQEWLRSQARAVFRDKVVVVNRRFGRAYSENEMESLVDLEVRQRMRQLNYYKGRRGVDANPITDESIDTLLEQHVEKIHGQWLKVTEKLDPNSRLVKRWMEAAGVDEPPAIGSWIDTRANVEIPRVYARHLKPAYLPDGGLLDAKSAAGRRLASREAGRAPTAEPDGLIPAKGKRQRNTIPFALNRENLRDVVVGRPGEGGEALMRRAGVAPFTPASPLVRGIASFDGQGRVSRIDFLTWDKDTKKWQIRHNTPDGWGEAAHDAIQRSFSANVTGDRSVLGAITDVDASRFARVDDEIQRLVAAVMDTPPLGKFDFEGRPFARGFRGKDEPQVGGPLGDSIEEISDYQNAMISRAEHLQAAYDAVLPRILLREGAVWQAMAESRAGWLKVLYTGMSAWLDVWTTLTLPFRPAFAIRNVIDNTVKMLVAGVNDPRMFFLGGEKPGSVFEVDLRAVRYVLSVGHKYDQNPALRYFDNIVQEVWELGSGVLGRVFEAHGVPVPEEAIDGMKISRLIDTPVVKRYQLVSKGDDLRSSSSVVYGYWKDRVWELMADRPETFAKRAVYRDTYYKAIKRGATSVEAFDEAMRKVDHVLFDYSKLSTLEHNLKFVFPFAYYWRKTGKFWGAEALSKPWLPADFEKFTQARDQAHADEPDWMRRYFNASWVNDVIGLVPGLEWMVPGLSDFSTQFDPVNFFSFAPLYRSFKSENPGLPPDKAGMKFISGFADALNDMGLSFNPLVRKPLEAAGVFNFRAWQSMFPQTPLVDAFTRTHLKEMFPNGFNLEQALTDPIFDAVLGLAPGEMNEQRLNELTQKEVAAQVARGEKPSRARARKKVEQFEYAKNVVAFFAGVYTRNNDPGEHLLYKIADELRKEEIDYLDLPPTLQRAYSLFKRRGWSARGFDRYQQALPSIQAYQAIGDWEESERFKERHPEILPYTQPGPSSKPITSHRAIRYVPLQVDTQATIKLMDWAKGFGINPDLKETARKTLVTPELEAFWQKNDTPAKTKELMLRGEFWRYFKGVQDTYFAIPHTDFKHRESFLRDNPILSAGWGVGNSTYDDLTSVEGQFAADMRERYGEFLDGDKPDWDGAKGFLKEHPFIFDGTSAEGRVWNGMLVPKNPKKAADFKRAYPGLQRYFALVKTNKKAAYRWLKGGSPLAKLALAYFAKYPSGSRSQHAKDYLKVKPLLDWFFKALAEEGEFRGYFSKWEWAFKSNDPAAKQLRWYFQKYANEGGHSQKAKDYLAAKTHLDHYFGLVKAGKRDEARAWLNGGSKGAGLVLAFFKKYSKTNKLQRRFAKQIRSRNPELNQRLRFWRRYFDLSPEQRPGFVHNQGETYGIFVYGLFGDEQRHQSEAQYLRWAKGVRLSEKAAMYLRLKPMLDFYFQLDGNDRKVFQRLNPEVTEYLAKYSSTDFTKDKRLNKLIATYVRMPDGSPDRSEFLRKHPEVQDYFDDKRPADRAMRNLLETYFDIDNPAERKDFVQMHPEIDAYFTARRTEREALTAELQAFDDTDPRLAELRDDAYRLIVLPGDAKRRQLAIQGAGRRQPDTIETRRDRRTEPIVQY